VLDADAFLALRRLGLLEPVLQGLASHTKIVLTGFVAGHELSAVQSVVADLQSGGVLTVAQVLKGTQAYRTYRDFRAKMARRDHDMRCVDIGEAESVAWGLQQSPTPVFVSCDTGAREFARRQRLRTTDVLGIGMAAVRLEVLSRDELSDLLSMWDSPAQFVCRPAGYTTFNEFFARRWTEESDLLDP
jgi:hypothetical protein